jgi:hypothetical protein
VLSCCLGWCLHRRNDLLRSLQAIEPSNRVREPVETSTDPWGKQCTSALHDENVPACTSYSFASLDWAGSIQLQLYSPPFPEYRRLFSELSPECGQVGLDDLFPAQRNPFLAEKTRVGDLVLAHQSVSMARQYSKTGCPVSLRPQVNIQLANEPTRPSHLCTNRSGARYYLCRSRSRIGATSSF